LNREPSSLAKVAVAILLLAVLGGCSYDYMQRTDRVGYSAGNAVKANLAQQTTNPMKASMYSTKGLGKNGTVLAEPAAAPAE
jgi:ABC-type uncharacterized transport system auxiliary subunit